MRQEIFLISALLVLLHVLRDAVAETVLPEVGKEGDCGTPKRLIQKNKKVEWKHERKCPYLFRKVPQGPLFCTLDSDTWALCEDGAFDLACERNGHGRVRQCPCAKPWTCNVCEHGADKNCCHIEEKDCCEFDLQLPSRPVKYERAQVPHGPYYCTPTRLAKCEDGRFSKQCDENQVEYGGIWAYGEKPPRGTFDVRVLECPCHSPYKCTPCEKGNNCCVSSKDACLSKGKEVLVTYKTRAPTPAPTMIPQWTLIWKASGGQGEISVWRPSSSSGFCSLGDVIVKQKTDAIPNGTKASYASSTCGRAPVDFKWVAAENIEGGINYWEPVCEAGYVSLGHVGVQKPESSKTDADKPPLTSVCCVPEATVKWYKNGDGVTDRLWSDPGTGGRDNCEHLRKDLHTFIADEGNCAGRFSPPCHEYAAGPVESSCLVKSWPE